MTGQLVFVVGPSGAGKDTLIDYARSRLLGDANVRFVRRAITRPPSAGEEHLAMSEADFEQAVAENAFFMHWTAHGLRYGLPAVISDWLSSGHVVVVNGSRAVLPEIRRLVPSVEIVNVTAAPEIIAKRLEGRNREDADRRRARMKRSAEVDVGAFDVYPIDNSGDVETAGKILAAHLTRSLSNLRSEWPASLSR